MKLTVISHFYNEEYLLPWWLKFHREVFDDGVLIDHGSNDRSREIIEQLCPHWRVVQTITNWFDPVATDQEVNEYERQSPGWKIVLNTTEFLCGKVRESIRNASLQGIRPNGVALVDHPQDFGIEPSPHMPIHKQRHWGITTGDDALGRRRLLHCYSSVPYVPGRHKWPNDCEDDTSLTVVHLLTCPMTESFISRKLQIKDRIIPFEPIESGGGAHHRFDRDTLLAKWQHHAKHAVFLPDCRFWRDTTRCWC